ncbi:MAG: hypothetical protein ACLQPH_18890 [Acidimicrobiales bacterium]
MARTPKPIVPVTVRGRSDYERLTPKEQEARHRAYEAISEMRREGVSLKVAAHRVGTTPKTVRRYASETLVKDGRRYRATPSDRSYQRMSALSTEGLRDIDVRGSRARSLVGGHWSAIGRFAATGDVSVLAKFRQKRVGGIELATEPDLIEEYLRQGELDIDDIYV